MTSERMEADVLAALSAVHDGGHNLLTHLYGIERDAVGECEAVGTIDARPQSLDAEGRFAATPTLMLADLTLGRSVKSYFGPDTPGVTSAIDVDLYAPLPVGGRLTCRAQQTLTQGRRASAEGWLIDDAGVTVGNVRGRFVALQGPRRAPERSRQPLGGTVVDGRYEPSEAEHELLETLAARDAQQQSGLGPCATLLGRATPHRLETGEVELRQRLGLLVKNQTDRVQGGVIAGMLFDACRDPRLHEGADWGLSTFSLRFLHGGAYDGDDLVATARVDQRETERGTACVSARLDQSPRSGLALATAIVARHAYGRTAATSTTRQPTDDHVVPSVNTIGGSHEHL